MSYTRRLRDILKEKNPSLHSKLEEIEKLASAVLTYTAGGFPYFTPHGFTHSLKVEENLDWLIPDEEKPKLNDWEIFFLIVAAWMHDWGMVCKAGEKPEEVRQVHHIRTENNFEALYDKLKLDKHEAIIIGRIARGHRKEDLRGSLFDARIHSTNVHIDIRFLAALLRIADECDITYNRVPELIYYSLDPQGASQEHFERHLSIGGIGKEGKHKITFYGIAYDPKGSETLYRLRDKIQQEVNHVKGIFAEKNIPIEYVEARVDARGFIDKPISFRLDEKRITQMLIGEALYSRKDVAIRELLQNSVDACRLRKSLEPSATISVRIYREGNKLVIQDNGVGMDYEIAYNFLANKGFSYYTSEEFNKLKNDVGFDPVSRFGLGVLSCFLIASEIIVETMKKGKSPCRFIIKDVAEGWRFEQGSIQEAGTIITLTLNDEGLKFDLERVIRHYMKVSAVPIFVGKETSQPLKLNWSIDDDDDVQEILKRHRKMGGEELKVSFFEEIENDDFLVRFYKVNSSSLISGRGFLANQGFFVERFPDLIRPHGLMVLLNTKKEILDLNVAREYVREDTARFYSLKKKWFQVLNNLMEKEVQEMLDKSKRTLVDQFYIRHTLLDEYRLLHDEFLFGTPQWSNLTKDIKEFVLHKMPNLVLTKEGLKLLNLENMISIKPKKIKVYDLYSHNANLAMEEIAFVESLLSNKLEPTEILALVPRHGFPSLLDIYYEQLKDIVGYDIEIERVAIQQLLASSLIQIKTDLDYLLPPDGHFSKLPEPLRGGVVCKLPYVVQISRYMDESDVAVFLFDLVKYDTDDMQLIQNGILVFDAEDNFIKILLQNTERISTSLPLQNMLRNYFKLLACFNFTPTSVLEGILELKECEILSLIGNGFGVKTLESRIGKLCRVLSRGYTNVQLKEHS